MSVDHFISTGNLPPPVTLEQLGARILAQERAGTGKVGTEGTSNIVLIYSVVIIIVMLMMIVLMMIVLIMMMIHHMVQV
jgi:hypothetical protein